MLVCGMVRDGLGDEVSFLFRNKTEGLTYLPQNNDDGGWGRQEATVEWRHLGENDQRRGEGVRLVDVSILDWIQSDVDLRF